jgi:hypothetical protein
LRRQRGHSQIQSLHAQAGQAEQDAERRRAQAAEDQCGDQRHVWYADEKIVRAVSTDRHEGARAERDLAAVADQNVDAYGRQRKDQKRNQDRAEKVIAGQQRHGDEGDRQHERHDHAVLGDREDLLVGLVRRLELAVFAVQHLRSPKISICRRYSIHLRFAGRSQFIATYRH